MSIPRREFVLSQKSEELVASAYEPLPKGMYPAARDAHPVPPEETARGELSESEPRDSIPMLALVVNRVVLLAVVAKKLVEVALVVVAFVATKSVVEAMEKLKLPPLKEPLTVRSPVTAPPDNGR